MSPKVVQGSLVGHPSPRILTGRRTLIHIPGTKWCCYTLTSCRFWELRTITLRITFTTTTLTENIESETLWTDCWINSRAQILGNERRWRKIKCFRIVTLTRNLWTSSWRKCLWYEWWIFRQVSVRVAASTTYVVAGHDDGHQAARLPPVSSLMAGAVRGVWSPAITFHLNVSFFSLCFRFLVPAILQYFQLVLCHMPLVSPFKENSLQPHFWELSLNRWKVAKTSECELGRHTRKHVWCPAFTLWISFFQVHNS